MKALAADLHLEKAILERMVAVIERTAEMNPSLAKTAICGWCDISYQALNQMKLRFLRRALLEALLLGHLLETRHVLPQIGVRKLHHLP